MNFYTRRKRPLTINIVALIDILILLLIFFIVATTFKKTEHHLEIKLPESATAKQSSEPKEPTIIYATKDQKIFINQQEIKITELEQTLKLESSHSPGSLFALKADKDVPLGFFVKVIDASTAAGLANLSLFTEEKSKTQQP